MDNPGTSVSGDQNAICKLCNIKPRRYTCPRCEINYCSAECYKSEAHIECSESFYKQCVEEELNLQQNDPELKQKTLDMLQRIHQDDTEEDLLEDILNDDEFDNMDSDDEHIPELEARLANVNFDNPEELWAALTESEKQGFEASVNTGEMTKLLPTWVPWWTHKVEKKLVEDLSEEKQTPDYINHCPKVKDVPAISAVANASTCLAYNLVNVLYAYAYTVLHFYGDHLNSPIEALTVFLRICSNISENRVFKDETTAIENVLLNVTNCQAIAGDQETIIATKEAGDCIIRGPEEENRTYYAKVALSDLYNLMNNAKEEISQLKKTPAKDEFRKKFQQDVGGSTELTNKNIQLYMKKLEYYLAWLESKGSVFNLAQSESQE